MSASFELFSHFGGPAKTKLLYLGSPDFRPEALMSRVRSLHIEHVSPAAIRSREISRIPSTSLAVDEATSLARLRRWFFARKPDAGFLLTEFPATLLQAKVFDEWLEARGEDLDAVHSGPGASASVVAHYRTLGLLLEGAGFAGLSRPTT